MITEETVQNIQVAPALDSIEDLERFIRADDWMMQVLGAAQSVMPADHWVNAGFIRNAVWDALHGYADSTPLNDIDVAYFDPLDREKSSEQAFDRRLSQILPITWSAKNQARMMKDAKANEVYRSAGDGIASFPETATAIGAKLNQAGELELFVPHGVSDLFGLILRPSPAEIARGLPYFHDRIDDKGWLEQWPNLTVLVPPSH